MKYNMPKLAAVWFQGELTHQENKKERLNLKIPIKLVHFHLTYF